VIILAADTVRVAAFKSERDSVRIVHSDAVAPLLITLQSLQPIARRNTEITQRRGRVHHVEFPAHHEPNILCKFARLLCVHAVEHVSCRLISEGRNHGENELYMDTV
jgi:hypothetical protein